MQLTIFHLKDLQSKKKQLSNNSFNTMISENLIKEIQDIMIKEDNNNIILNQMNKKVILI